MPVTWSVIIAVVKELLLWHFVAGRTHRFYTGLPTVPFGFGLSFTNFTYSITSVWVAPHSRTGPYTAAIAQALDLDSVSKALGPFATRPFPPQVLVERMGTIVQHEITVTNTGMVDADDVVLGFVKPPGAGKDGVPLQSL